MTTRSAHQHRETKETTVDVRLAIDGGGDAHASTGIPFFDHMLEQLGKHGGFDLAVEAQGDLAVDLHHTVEDVGIVVGTVLKEALGDKQGVRRFADAIVPLKAVGGQVLRDDRKQASQAFGTTPELQQALRIVAVLSRVPMRIEKLAMGPVL